MGKLFSGNLSISIFHLVAIQSPTLTHTHKHKLITFDKVTFVCMSRMKFVIVALIQWFARTMCFSKRKFDRREGARIQLLEARDTFVFSDGQFSRTPIQRLSYGCMQFGSAITAHE